MKIEAIAKKNRIHQFSNVILGNYLNLLSRIFFFISKENWKIFQNRLLFPLWTYFFEKRFRFCFLPTMVCTIHTRQLYARIYTGGTAFSARKTPAIAMPETSCASAVFYPFHLFSLFLLRSLFSFSLFLSLSLSEDIWKSVFGNNIS